MKKIFLLLLVPVCSWAQFAKGNKFIGGSVSINNQNNNITSPGISLNQFISINPSVATFINEKLAIGIGIGYTRQYQESALSSPYIIKSSEGSSWHAGLFAKRYYSISEKFFFSLTGSVNYERGANDYDIQNGNIYGGNHVKYYSISTQINPGFIYFPSQHWGIEASIGSLYFTHSYNFTNEINANTFNLNYGSFSLGFAYYIR